MATILTTAILARILSEEDFGVVAITVLVVTMFDLLTSVGLGAALIRRDVLTSRVTSTLFWTAIPFGIAAGLLAVGVSQPAAVLAGDAEAAPLIRLASITIPLNLAASIPIGIMTRRFKFRAMATIDLGGAIVHALFAVPLAVLGQGALSVVVGQIARSAFRLIGSVVASGFRPRLAFDRHVVREDLSFNVAYMGSDVVTYANKNVDYWFVGSVLGTAQLGLYYVAYVVPNLLRRRITGVGLEVMYPIVSRMQSEPARIGEAFLRVTRLMAFVLTPAMLGLAATADLVVAIGFGDQWAEAAAPLAVLALGAAATSVAVVGKSVFPALGSPLTLVWIGMITLGVLAVGLAIALPLESLAAVATAVLVANVIESVAVVSQLRKIIDVSYLRFLQAIAPFVLSAFIMAGVTLGLRVWLTGIGGVVPQALASFVVAAVTYFVVGLLLFGEQFREQMRIAKGLMRSGS